MAKPFKKKLKKLSMEEIYAMTYQCPECKGINIYPWFKHCPDCGLCLEDYEFSKDYI